MTTVVLAAFLLAATPALARIPANQQAWQWKYRVWMPAVYQRIAWCEGGTRFPAAPNWKHDSGTYSGAFGFHIAVWRQYKYAGYPARASEATPWQQFRVALRLHDLYGFTPWGCWTHNAWVRG